MNTHTPFGTPTQTFLEETWCSRDYIYVNILQNGLTSGFPTGSGGGDDHEFPPPRSLSTKGVGKEKYMYIQYYAVISVKIGHCFQHKKFKLFFPTFGPQVPNVTFISEDQSLNIWNNSGIYSHGPILLDCMYIVYVQSIFSAAIQNFGLKFSWNIFYYSLNIGKNFWFLVICRITKVS